MTAQLVALATSCVTIAQMWAAGSLRPWAWKLGLANQALWFVFIVSFGAWGLLPLNLALVVVYSRNHLLWRPDEPEMPDPVDAMDYAFVRMEALEREVVVDDSDRFAEMLAAMTSEELRAVVLAYAVRATGSGGGE